ncbi:MAG: DNA internalization-related competence protein ComEC/Rec2 [Chloroflexi bacterium]|nr:DNA internalization-related competence protein ComEC/Rec2 [Chloroflexota bacterium]
MPRAGWLATGAVVAALLLHDIVPGMAALVGLLACLGALIARVARRPAGVVVGLGAAGVAVRLLVGDLGAVPAAPPPSTVVTGAWSAEVLSLGSTDGALQRATLLVTPADDADGDAPDTRRDPLATDTGPWRTYAWLPRYPWVIPGDHIRFDARIEPVVADGSEFAAWLIETGMAATTRPRSMVVATDGGSPVAERVREAVDLAIARIVPEPMAGLASGILVGRRDRVSREVADSFTTTGLSHVVAISGWNICIVGAVVGGLLAATRLSRRERTVGIVLALVAFTFIAGGGASVVRASVMGGVALIARESGRPGTAAAALGIAVWLLLLGDPAMVTDIGFQLSVAATAGLLAWGSRLAGRLAGPAPGRPRRWLAESLGVSLAAQAATLPLILFHFGRLSLVSPLANLLVAPIVAPAMLAGFLALVAGLLVGVGVPALLGAPVALLGWLVLGAMIAISGTLGSVPFASVELGSASLVSAALATVLVTSAIIRTTRHRGAPAVASPAHGHAAPSARAARRPAEGTAGRRRARTLTLIGVLVVVTAGVLVTVDRPSGRLTVTVLDIGQGDAILVEGPRGTRMLLDSGPDPDRLMTVLDRHIPPWDRRLDLVILTHPHEDHAAGLATLLTRYRVAVVAENGMLGTGPGDVAFRGWLARAGVGTTRLSRGARWTLDDAVAQVAWPIAAEVPVRSPSSGRQVNDTSVVVDLRFGARRFLLTGDIEDDVDPRLLAAGIGDPTTRLDVLKVAHHGSASATSDAWLSVLQPRVALVSAGAGNPYGHPTRSTLERLRTRGAQVLRTDLDGDLQVSTDGHDLRVATSGGRPPRTSTGGRARRVGGRVARTDSGRVAQTGGGTPAIATSSTRAELAAPPRATGSPAWSPWLCAIPLPATTLQERPEPRPPRPARGTLRRPDPHPPSDTPTPRLPRPGSDPLACYDRVDDRPLPRGRRAAPSVRLAPGRDRSALPDGGGRGRVARIPREPRGPPGGHAARRDGRLAA